MACDLEPPILMERAFLVQEIYLIKDPILGCILGLFKYLNALIQIETTATFEIR